MYIKLYVIAVFIDKVGSEVKMKNYFGNGRSKIPLEHN